MTVDGLQAIAVVDDDAISVDAEPVGQIALPLFAATIGMS